MSVAAVVPMAGVALTAEQDAECRRLVISHCDLDDACGYASRLKDLPPRAGGEPSELILEREALLLSFIVSYSRPFKRNAAGDNTARTLDVASVLALTNEQDRIHNSLIALRDMQFAHSDPGPLHLSMTEDKTLGTVASMREPRPSISPAAASVYLALACAIRDAISARLRQLGVSGISREW